jgi:hypothetical protein
LAFAVDGLVIAPVERQPLATINETFRRIQDAELSAHVVLAFDDE